MKVAYASDLHVDFDFDNLPDLKSDADVLILAGDIVEARYYAAATNNNSGYYESGIKLLNWFKGLNDSYEYVIMVMGNHEHYHGEYSKTAKIIDSALALFELDNIHLIEKQTLVLDGVGFFGGTFWTDMGSELDRLTIKQSMNDFRLVKKKTEKGYSKFSPWDAAEIHAVTLQKLKSLHQAHGDNIKKLVVISHHAPAYESVPPKYRYDSSPYARQNPYSALNPAYYSATVEKALTEGLPLQPVVWVHGHVHNKTNYEINGTTVLANPRGYPMEESYSSFKLEFFEV
jgi:Icc-related predicted phosphoesterase